VESVEEGSMTGDVTEEEFLPRRASRPAVRRIVLGVGEGIVVSASRC
jgi:hypothetical protein